MPRSSGTERAGAARNPRTARNGRFHIALDCALTVVFVALMSTALVEEAPHEYLGIAAFVLVAAHAIANRRRLAALFGGGVTALKALQVITLVGAAACIVLLFASSLVISRYAFGFLPAIGGANWARRVHLAFSYWCFVLVFAHAGLNCVGAPAFVRRSGVARVAWCLVIGVLCIGGALSFVHYNFAGCMFGQVQFAYADDSVPLALSFVSYLSIAVLAMTLSALVRAGLVACRRHEHQRRITVPRRNASGR